VCSVDVVKHLVEWPLEEIFAEYLESWDIRLRPTSPCVMRSLLRDLAWCTGLSYSGV
jgi:hypothetical protein